MVDSSPKTSQISGSNMVQITSSRYVHCIKCGAFCSNKCNLIAKEPAKKLTLMYLANDVIQNMRKKGPEYSKEFATILKPAFEIVARLEPISLLFLID